MVAVTNTILMAITVNVDTDNDNGGNYETGKHDRGK